MSPNAWAASLVSPFFCAILSNTWATKIGNCGFDGWMCPLLPGNGISVSGGVSRTFKAIAICILCSACVLFSLALLPSQDLISKLYSRRFSCTPVLVLFLCWPPGPLPWKPFWVQAASSWSNVI